MDQSSTEIWQIFGYEVNLFFCRYKATKSIAMRSETKPNYNAWFVMGIKFPDRVYDGKRTAIRRCKIDTKQKRMADLDILTSGIPLESLFRLGLRTNRLFDFNSGVCPSWQAWCHDVVQHVSGRALKYRKLELESFQWCSILVQLNDCLENFGDQLFSLWQMLKGL